MKTQLYHYDVFYEILGEQATATVIASNARQAKVRFKEIYGYWRIIGTQRLGRA